jgi:hypothetical protein
LAKKRSDIPLLFAFYRRFIIRSAAKERATPMMHLTFIITPEVMHCMLRLMMAMVENHLNHQQFHLEHLMNVILQVLQQQQVVTKEIHRLVH